jgi:hypothetical protein
MLKKKKRRRSRKRRRDSDSIVHTCNPSFREAKIGRIVIQGWPGQRVSKTPSQPTVVCSGMCSSFQAMWEAEIRRIMVPGQPRQKKKYVRLHLNQKKMAHVCHPN